ncbi:MAG: T9SS type A sorting domain-containing protein [Saprospiraceae bacterium]|nr:T9SS type A sorting domain-containing protein [Saprospiraceae bacterium]
MQEFFISFPNPVCDFLTIQYSGSDKIKTIHIRDVSGKICESISLSISQTTIKVDVSAYPVGIYFIELFDLNANLLATGKFLKQM